MIGQLQPYQPADAEDVARLHRHIYHRTDAAPPAELVAYYRRVFFDNPWYDARLPSLVFRAADGTVSGFMGLIPRPWLFDGRLVHSVVGHRLMVPDGVPNAPLVAARLVRACLKAPHGFLISDASSEAARRAVTALGGIAIAQYSIRWFIPLKPFGLWQERAMQRRRLRMIAGITRPFCAFADSVLGSRGRVPDVDDSLAQAKLTTEDLVDSIELATRTMRLRPHYTVESLEWIVREMRSDGWRQGLDGFCLRRHGRVIGSCLYHFLDRGGMEIDVIASGSPVGNRQVLLAALAIASEEGVTHVFGRLEPRLAEVLWGLGCLMRPTPDCWTVAFSRDAAIIRELEAGRVFLSNLDAELWLGVPMSYAE